MLITQVNSNGISIPKEKNTLVLNIQDFNQLVNNTKELIESHELRNHLDNDFDFQGAILFSDNLAMFSSDKISKIDIKRLIKQIYNDKGFIPVCTLNKKFFKFELDNCYLIVKRYINELTFEQVFIGHILLKSKTTQITFSNKPQTFCC